MSYNNKLVMQWVLIMLIAFQFLFYSINQALGVQPTFTGLNYPAGYHYVVLVAILLSTTGLFYSKTRKVACMIQIILLMGSGYYNFQTGRLFEMLISIGTIGLCTIILWLEQERSLTPTHEN